MRGLLAGKIRDTYVRYEVDDLRFLRPDVALCRILGFGRDAHGNAVRNGAGMVAQYLFVKQDGRWWIASRQNTLVDED